MFRRLFPTELGNDYRGARLAVWLLPPLALAKVLQGVNVASRSAIVLERVDRVPLPSFPTEAASQVEFLFAVWGLCIVILGCLGLLAIARYRAMIPLAFLCLLIEQLGRTVLAVVYLDRAVLPARLSPALLVNWAFLAAAAIGFLLSLSDPTNARAAGPPGAEVATSD